MLISLAPTSKSRSPIKTIGHQTQVTNGSTSSASVERPFPRNKIEPTDDEHHVIHILPHFHLSPRITERLNEKNMQHVNNMPTAMRETSRGCDSFADRTFNKNASIATAHVEINIQGIDSMP
eukprot:6463207-Amphidinium_carterae.1